MKQLNAWSLVRISMIPPTQCFLIYMEEDKVIAVTSINASPQCSEMSSCAASFWLNFFFSAPFYVKWGYLSIQFLWWKFVLSFPVVLLVLMFLTKDKAKGTHGCWLFSLSPSLPPSLSIWLIIMLQAPLYLQG